MRGNLLRLVWNSEKLEGIFLTSLSVKKYADGKSINKRLKDKCCTIHTGVSTGGKSETFCTALHQGKNFKKNCKKETLGHQMFKRVILYHFTLCLVSGKT